MKKILIITILLMVMISLFSFSSMNFAFPELLRVMQEKGLEISCELKKTGNREYSIVGVKVPQGKISGKSLVGRIGK